MVGAAGWGAWGVVGWGPGARALGGLAAALWAPRGHEAVGLPVLSFHSGRLGQPLAGLGFRIRAR